MDLTVDVQALVLETLRSVYENQGQTLSLDTDLGDIEFDSLGLTALVARAELTYQVSFSSEDILAMYQSMLVADLAEAVETGITHCRSLVDN